MLPVTFPAYEGIQEGSSMHIGVTMAFSHRTEPSHIGQAARLVEELGFHSVWVPEHVLFLSGL